MTMVQAIDRAAQPPVGAPRVPPATNDLVSQLVAAGKIAPVPALPHPATRVEQPLTDVVADVSIVDRAAKIGRAHV